MNDMEKIQAQLDKDCPRWWFEWADTTDLRDYLQMADRGDAAAGRVMLKSRLSSQIHSIAHAALAAGVVQIPGKDA